MSVIMSPADAVVMSAEPSATVTVYLPVVPLDTTSTMLLFTPPKSAVITVSPAETSVTLPVSSTVATSGTELVKARVPCAPSSFCTSAPSWISPRVTSTESTPCTASSLKLMDTECTLGVSSGGW